MSRLTSIFEHDELNRTRDTAEPARSDVGERERDGRMQLAALQGRADSAPSPADSSSSLVAAGLGTSGNLGGRARTPLFQGHPDLIPYTHSSSPPQGTRSPHGGRGSSYSPAHSLGSQGYSVDGQNQSVNEGDNNPHQFSRSRPTPASNFAALFPPPQSLTSVTTTHPAYPPYSSQAPAYQQSVAHPAQSASSRPSPLPSNRFHPYSQSSPNFGNSGSFGTHSTTSNSTGSPAPPSLSHSVSSTTHSLVSSRPSSRAVSASGFASPYCPPSLPLPNLYSGVNTSQSSTNVSTAPETLNFDPSIRYVPSSLPSWPHPTGSSADSKPHRSNSSGPLGLPSYSYSQRRVSAPSQSSNPQLARASSSRNSYYSFDGEQEEQELKLVVGTADPRNRPFEHTGRRDSYASNLQTLEHGSPYTPAQFNQHAVSNASGFGAGTVVTSSNYSERDSTGSSGGLITGARGLLTPYTPQEQHPILDREKPGTSHQNEHQLLQQLSDNTTFNTTNLSSHTTMSGNMYHADVDMDPLESYDDDDLLSGLPHGSYDAAGEYTTMGSGTTGGGGKKDGKQVRRRSSKACDQCRKSKCKCERTGDGEPCKSCIMLGTPCTFLGPSRKRGPPKGYIDAIESRLHQTEALVGIILALANPERSVLDGDDPSPDERARSLLEDLRNNDPLAREIVERVDRGAYGTKGRKNNANVDGKGGSQRAGSVSADERSSGSAGTVKDGDKVGMAGPPASVQGRGRMVGLGQEMELSSLSSAHPSNEWQDTVAARLKATIRTRNSFNTASNSSGFRSQNQTQNIGADGERERQRRRMDPLASAQQLQVKHSSERLVYPQSNHRQSIGALIGSSDQVGGLTTATSAVRYSPPVSSYSSSAYTNAAGVHASAAHPSSYTHSDMDSNVDESENVEGEESITGGVGQLSINEEAQVRFHGKASGLHLLGQKLRMDGRNKGGIWHFPKARVWPPVAPTSVMHIARAEEAEACEHAARARLPARDVQEHLLELYFAHVHPFLPIVHKKTFMQDFKDMHDEAEKCGKPGSARESSDLRGRPSAPSKDPSSDRADRSTSVGNGSSINATTPEAAGTDANDRSTSRSPVPRIPTLLLLAMFAIAARYAPVAHGTAASPFQVLLEPAQTVTDALANSKSASESAESLGADVASPAASKTSEAEAASDLEDSTLPHPSSGHMWAAGDGFLERAKILLDKNYASSRPSTCQALILMGYREIGIGAMAQSWLYVGMAVRMAQDLGMHRSSDSWSCDDEPIFSPIEQQIRKRIWYACVVMDKYVSTYIGRPLSIFEADYDTRLPSSDESEELELWEPHNSMPNSILADPVEVATAPLPSYAPVPGRVLTCFNESARLSSIIAMIVQAIYAVSPVSSRHLEALQLERTLDKWYMDLPEYLRYDTSVKSTTSPPPNVLTLHMQYWCAVLLLHRPFVPHYITMRRKRLNPESPVDQNAYAAAQKNYSLCVSAANHITSIVSIYQEHFCLKRCAVFLSYYIFTAGIMHMTTMATNPNDPQASLGLNKCMDVLKRVEVVWPSAGRAWELLHGAKDDLPDYEMPLTSSDRSKKRAADEPPDTVLLGDPPYLPGPRSAPAAHSQLYAPTAVSGQRYDPALEIAESGHPLSLFNSYSRWSSENSLGFPSGLSTSVLPQQYSTGFIEDRNTGNVHRSQAAAPDGSGRYPQYWSDYSMGQPSSMLGSMYDMSILPHANHNDQSGQQTPNGSHHAPGYQSAPPVYMNDQYNVFNPLPPP